MLSCQWLSLITVMLRISEIKFKHGNRFHRKLCMYVHMLCVCVYLSEWGMVGVGAHVRVWACACMHAHAFTCVCMHACMRGWVRASACA